MSNIVGGDNLTREEQRRNNEWKKYLALKSKEYFRQYNLKKRNYSFYTSKNNMFYSMVLSMVENKVKIAFYAKPMWLDDILWDILNMSENKNEPISLRGIGAFTINSKIKGYDSIVSSTEDIDKVIIDTFESFINFTNSYSESDFLNNYKSISYQQEMINVIVLLYKKKQQEALKYLCNTKIDNFIIKNKNFSQLAMEYIMNR